MTSTTGNSSNGGQRPAMERRVSDAQLLDIKSDVAMLRKETMSRLDKLGEAMLTLVRMDERMASHDKTIDRMRNEMDVMRKEKERLRDAVQEVKAEGAVTENRVGLYERLAWAGGVVLLGAKDVADVAGLM